MKHNSCTWKYLFVMVIGMIIFFVSTASSEEFFLPIGHMPEGTVYLDANSIIQRGSIYQFDMKFPYSDSTYPNSHIISKMEIDISTQMQRAIGGKFYDNSGKLLQDTGNTTTQWQPIENGTPMEAAMLHIQMIEGNYPSLIQKYSSGRVAKRERYIYIGVDTDKNEVYLDSHSISYNPDTQIAKFQTKIILDKVSQKKKLKTKRFRSIRKKMSSATVMLGSYYMDLSKNEIAYIKGSIFSDSALLYEAEGNCKYEPINHSSLFWTVRNKLLEIMR